MSLVNPDFRLVHNLISSSLDKVNTGKYNLQSFIASVAPVKAAVTPTTKFSPIC